MVLEYLINQRHLEKHFSLSFMLGIIYSLIGISLARIIFGANSGIAAVMFSAILLIPSMRKMFAHEQRVEEKEHKFILKHFVKDNEQLIKTYLGVFIGVFVCFFLYTVVAAKFGQNIFRLFPEQLALGSLSGKAFSTDLLFSILENNLLVLLLCFLLSILSGNGAIFFIVWNASVWSVVFAARSILASQTLNQSLAWVSTKLLVITTPHIFFEGMSYILAGIAGAVISNDILSEKQSMSKFIYLFVLIGLGFYVFNFFIDQLFIMFPFIFKILIFLIPFYFLKNTFKLKKHREVFIYNYWLFIIAILFFIIGALIETGVLINSDTLYAIYFATS